MAPRGFRDVLPQEAAERRAISDAVLRSFGLWGYGEVETCAVEMLETLERGAGGSLAGTAFRFIDSDGSLLALRPEMTLPIARLAASHLADEPRPLRLCYAAPVFRERESLRGEARQFTQLGIELIGVNGPLSDAEVAGALVEALEAAGLPDFTVGIGTMGVLLGLLDASGADASWRERFLVAAHRRNLVAVDRLAAEDGPDPAVAGALRELLRVSGGAEAIEQGRCLARAGSCAERLDGLAETLALLEEAGLAGRVRVDFGILRSFDYYTGLVVEAYAPGLGLPLGGGGRYDAALAAYDAPEPAAGFALSLERLHIALTEQDAVPAMAGRACTPAGDGDAAVFAAAAAERRAGRRCAIPSGGDR